MISVAGLFTELGDLAADDRRVFLELGRAAGVDSPASECVPPLDVFETDETVEVRADLPGVDSQGVRVVAKGNGVLIAGEKRRVRGRGDSSFHLVERGFGRFARAVRLTVPCDATRANAVLVDGELRISLPKVPDRRGLPIPIRVTGAIRTP